MVTLFYTLYSKVNHVAVLDYSLIYIKSMVFASVCILRSTAHFVVCFCFLAFAFRIASTPRYAMWGKSHIKARMPENTQNTECKLANCAQREFSILLNGLWHRLSGRCHIPTRQIVAAAANANRARNCVRILI